MILATSGEGTVAIPVPALGNEKVYYIKVSVKATKDLGDARAEGGWLGDVESSPWPKA